MTLNTALRNYPEIIELVRQIHLAKPFSLAARFVLACLLVLIMLHQVSPGLIKQQYVNPN
jgi:hypothetical protein